MVFGGSIACFGEDFPMRKLVISDCVRVVSMIENVPLVVMFSCSRKFDLCVVCVVQTQKTWSSVSAS